MCNNRQRSDGRQQRQPRQKQNEKKIFAKSKNHPRHAGRRNYKKDQGSRFYAKNDEKTVTLNLPQIWGVVFVWKDFEIPQLVEFRQTSNQPQYRTLRTTSPFSPAAHLSRFDDDDRGYGLRHDRRL